MKLIIYLQVGVTSNTGGKDRNLHSVITLPKTEAFLPVEDPSTCPEITDVAEEIV